MDKFNDFQPSDQGINLKGAIDLILDFNEELHQIWFEHNSSGNTEIKK